MLLQLAIFYFLTAPVALQEGGSMTFTASDLRFFASLGLCNHFGGSCGFTCPHRYIRHKWNIPLCPSRNLECCIGPPPTVSTPVTVTSTLSPTMTTTGAAALRLPPTESCGLVSSASRRRKRIVGGEISAPGSWPWLVALRSVLGSHTCSGAVISRRWILTAAHCFKHISSPSLWRVRTGEYDLLRYDAGERDQQIDEIIMHPGYRSSVGQPTENQTLYARYVHDIALVRLRQDTGIQPICLPPSESSNSNAGGATRVNSTTNNTNAMGAARQPSGQSAYGQCWVAGWGITMDSVVEDQLLRQVTGEVIDSQQCSQMWGSRLEDDMLCFGNGTFGPCAGDSGGPLSCERDGHFFLEGVVSWGTEDCTRNGYPSVFTRVRSYVTWIESHVGTEVNVE